MSRFTQLAILVFLVLLIGYGLVGYLFYQDYQGETALYESLSKNGPLWQTLRRQPVVDTEALKAQIVAAEAKVAKQQALFPKEPESIAALDKFLALARENQFLILRLDAQPIAQYKTKGGTYQVARYSVQALGDLAHLPAFVRKLAEQSGPVALSLENLSINVLPGGDDIRFDLLIYVRVA